MHHAKLGSYIMHHAKLGSCIMQMPVASTCTHCLVRCHVCISSEFSSVRFISCMIRSSVPCIPIQFSGRNSSSITDVALCAHPHYSLRPHSGHLDFLYYPNLIHLPFMVLDMNIDDQGHGIRYDNLRYDNLRRNFCISSAA